MPGVPNPPLDHFLRGLSSDRAWAQILIRKHEDHFELRHLDDRAARPDLLETVEVDALRGIAETTSTGSFRPLRTAPTLRKGWRCLARGSTELGRALDHLYPGSLADAWAAFAGATQPARFQDVLARLLGRAAEALRACHGPALAAVVSAYCGASFCLKHRRWTAPGVTPDDGVGKSELPCLEPCPVFLAFAQSSAGTQL